MKFCIFFAHENIETQATLAKLQKFSVHISKIGPTAENSHNLFNVSYTWYKSLKRTILHPPGSQWIFYMYPFGPSKVLCKLQPFEIQQVGVVDTLLIIIVTL